MKIIGQKRLSIYDKIAILLYDIQNAGGEINLCDICYHKEIDNCKWERVHCINGVALKLESEVGDDTIYE